ncbi:uncharacterized protein LOC119721040 [Patiria miniata]|uniref:Uncharacterized protein n=1 Tax=Patiria miniata TaxID=46514 RepID=A0A913Z7N0_PATMI|nr:uncharacterized protein LOC119721040 [Patiria miniata]
MGDCLSNRLVVLGVALFAALYLLAGAMMAAVGLVAFLKMPVLFSTGCIIWVGFVVFLCGAVLFLMSVCNKEVSLHKSYLMILLCLTVLLVSIANIVLIETIEWNGVRVEKVSQDIDETMMEASNSLTIFLTYLLGLLGSVIGLVASFFGMIYIYFTLSVPLLKATQKSKPQHEVKMKRSLCDKYRNKPPRKFNFKLTPPPDSKVQATTRWHDDDADLYHVRWVYDEQSPGPRPNEDETPAGGSGEQRAADNKALMDEIKEKVGSRRLPSTSLDVTAQMNTSMTTQPDGTSQGSLSEDLVLGRIGQLPPNARSSFRRHSNEESDKKVAATQL